MGSASLIELVILGVLIAVHAFLTAAEVGIVSVPKARLRQMDDDGVAEARLIHDLAENSSRLLATVQVGVTLAGFFAAATNAVTLGQSVTVALEATGVSLLVTYAKPVSLFIVTVLLALVMLIFGELVPRSVALTHSERVALLLARPVSALAVLFRPLVLFLTSVTDLFVPALGGRPGSMMPFITEDEIKTMVDAGQEVGAVEEGEKAMIYGVFGLSETLVREVMVPRVDMAAVEATTPLRDAATIAVESGHSRLPVYEESLDRIVGILHQKDLVAALLAETPPELRSILHPPYFVPETKCVDDLLREMQKQHVHMAIVVDEYGGTDGLVTIEDLLEEIVGEIQDEHDREEAQIERLANGSLLFDGRVSLDEVNELLDLELTGADVATVGGFVSVQLGKIPTKGDRLEVPGATIEVVATAARRARKVRITRHPVSDNAVEEDIR